MKNIAVDKPYQLNKIHQIKQESVSAGSFLYGAEKHLKKLNGYRKPKKKSTLQTLAQKQVKKVRKD